MRRLAILVNAGLLAGALTGCAVVGPDFEPPSPELPQAYDAPIPSLFEGQASEGPWWGHLRDPVLDELITRGLDANLDIRVALSRVREARATARSVAAGTGPSVDASAEAGIDVRRESGDGADDSDTGGAASAGLDGAWELDLFGGLTRTREAAWARAAREQALGHEARRLAIAEITRAYVELRAAERRLKLTLRSLDALRQTLALVDKRVEAGLAPALDRVRARAEVSTVEAQVAPLRAEIRRQRNALAVLLAEPPGAVNELLADREGEVPSSTTGAAVGVPADLVRRRPDVRAAELQIAAATAEVGVAAAELYPSLTLPGTISVGWTGIGDGSVVTTVMASLSALFEIPLYDGGRREAEVTAAEERLIQTTLRYRQTLLTALQDVESALAGYRGARQRRLALAEAVENNRVAYEQSQELYRQGFVTFIDVLDSQRTWNASRQELANAERDVSLAVINLYTALGADPVSNPAADDGTNT